MLYKALIKKLIEKVEENLFKLQNINYETFSICIFNILYYYY